MINDILKQKNLEAIIVTSPENLYYFSGFTGGEGLLVFTPEKKYIIVDGRYTIQAKEQTKDFEVIQYSVLPYKIVADMGFDKIGFEDKTISYNSFKMMSSAMPAVTLIGVSDELNEYRKVKSDEECKTIRRAEQIGDMAFEHILPFIKSGITEREIALELEYFMKKQGASALSFDTIVAVGERSALPHANLTDKKVEEGKVVLMDYGCVYNGYCSDMTRTVAVGYADDKTKNIYDIVLKAQLSAIDAIKAGVPNKDVDKIARDIIAGAGYGETFTHSLGHGVGLEVHEQPNLSPRSEDALKTGNIVTVEPGIYIEGFCGVRIEDLVLVTEDGCENFTHSSKDFIIL
ncbi:MAG: aminopeptidase P family protein [Clostridia bacterium]|nr:aminopeptidase P family protein [Clostridia bacterium]